MIENLPLSDEDRKNLKLFDIILRSNISTSTYNLLKKHFIPELSMSSIFILQARISKLSHVTEVSYDCCPNTCCCFTGTYAALDSCPFCKHARYNSEGHSYKKYKYLPIEPRIRSLYLTDRYAEVLRYRSVPRDNAIEDVFDGIHYRTLCQTRVTIDGAELDHRFFSEIPDVALGLMLDGFQIFRAQRDGGATCWPLIALNFNLPPDIRTQLAHIIPLSIIPGPKAPKDFNSFLHPFVDECKKLTAGVWAFDSHQNKTFKLHVYPISVHGDMMAIKYVMNFKGPNGKSPCRACHITRVRDTSQTRTPFYVPLTPPRNQRVGLISYDPHNLPLRSDDTYRTQLTNIQNAHSAGSRTQREKDYGINRECILTELPSISISRSFPHDWMHLCLENHGKNLVSFWKGTYKGVTTGNLRHFPTADPPPVSYRPPNLFRHSHVRGHGTRPPHLRLRSFLSFFPVALACTLCTLTRRMFPLVLTAMFAVYSFA